MSAVFKLAEKYDCRGSLLNHLPSKVLIISWLPLMRIFRPVNILIVSRNLWLILLSKICLFLDLGKHRFYFIYSSSKSVLICLQLRQFLSYQQFCYLSQNKCCENIARTLLPPFGRNWQLIYPNCEPLKNLGGHSHLLAIHLINEFFLFASPCLGWCYDIQPSYIHKNDLSSMTFGRMTFTQMTSGE